MTLGEIRQRLAENGFAIENESRLGNNTGTQLRLANGAIVNMFDKGTLSYQGKNTGEVKAAIEGGTLVVQPPSGYATNQVFVVYGHDNEARTQLEGPSCSSKCCT